MIIGTVHSKSVGKTTIAVHLAGWLDLYAYDVAIIDADWQQQCSAWLQDTAPRITRYVESNPAKIVKLAPKLHDRHQVVIIDGPAGLHETPGAVLAVSDAILIPCGPTAPEIDALSKVAAIVRKTQELRSSDETPKPWAIVVPVKTHPKTITTRVLLAEVAKLGFISSKHTIPARESYARLYGLPGERRHLMWQLGRSRDVKAAVQELDALFKEMLPEAAERDPELISRIMATPLRKANQQQKPITEEHEHTRLVGNS